MMASKIVLPKSAKVVHFSMVPLGKRIGIYCVVEYLGSRRIQWLEYREGEFDLATADFFRLRDLLLETRKHEQEEVS